MTDKQRQFDYPDEVWPELVLLVCKHTAVRALTDEHTDTQTGLILYFQPLRREGIMHAKVNSLHEKYNASVHDIGHLTSYVMDNFPSNNFFQVVIAL